MSFSTNKIHIGNREVGNFRIRVLGTEKIVKIIDDRGGMISLTYAQCLPKYNA